MNKQEVVTPTNALLMMLLPHYSTPTIIYLILHIAMIMKRQSYTHWRIRNWYLYWDWDPRSFLFPTVMLLLLILMMMMMINILLYSSCSYIDFEEMIHSSMSTVADNDADYCLLVGKITDPRIIYASFSSSSYGVSSSSSWGIVNSNYPSLRYFSNPSIIN